MATSDLTVPLADGTATPDGTAPIEPLAFRQWALLWLAVAVSVATYHLLSRLLGWPVEVGFSGVIDASVGRPLGWATVAAGLAVTLTCAALAVGRLRYEAPLLIACCGLAALAARGGPVGPVLRTAGRPQVYLAMGLETTLLLILISLAGGALIFFRRLRWLAPGSDGPIRPHQAILASLIQAAVTALVLFLLARSDVPKQTMTAVFVAALLGAIAAHQTTPVPSAAPFWVGTFLCALTGFAWAYHRPGPWPIGVPANPLAHVTPLSYASLGTAGATLGYWTSRRWRESDATDDPNAEEDADA